MNSEGDSRMRSIWTTALIIGAGAVCCPAQSQVDQIWNKAKAVAQATNATNAGLTNDKITAGLKEALTVSTGKAVASTGRPDGYFKNPAIKIPLPDNLRTVSKGMRLVGMGGQVDQLELGMNRAAEQAAPEAKRIFINAVTQMSFNDARTILGRSDTAATEYFKTHSSAELIEAFTPIVHQAMENVGVIQQYDRVMNKSGAASFVGSQKFNLDKYVVAKSLDGLFYMVGQEEKRIRTNPAAQTTAILRQVFGKK
jgi:hypothetical protein